MKKGREKEREDVKDRRGGEERRERGRGRDIWVEEVREGGTDVLREGEK